MNDQFPAHWEEEKKRRGAESPSMRDYPGENPLTEPEAIAIAEYTEKNCFDAVVALHTQGQEIYWNYRDYEPKESEKWAERLSSVSGYRSVRLSGSDAGYKDWFIQTFRKPGFTVEAGLGINPLPLWQTHQIKDEIAAILLELMSG
ncbi:M14 family zinc carboxypeptidase [Paenibacillus larvae]|uniref:M14 family zinc carboxypeptidase n=1 Tax=Paenibacillus larvae TaxID=1464 RepID=UPI0026A8C8B0|nr:M14 family zinc carboxypeptidase [Paenibacillus larvae]